MEKPLFAPLTERERPETLFITCSDSRIPPRELTGSEPGKLFILRSAGNLIPPPGVGLSGEAATIEYAVSALKVKDLILCGHTRCGAMQGILHPELLEDLPMLAAWLGLAETTRQMVRALHGDLRGQALVDAAAQVNVQVQLQSLRTFPAVAVALAAGRLRLHGWVYDVECAEVLAFDAKRGGFKRLDPARALRKPA